MWVALVLLLVLATAPVRAGEVSHPLLEQSTTPPASTATPGDAARALPKTVAVCADPARGCWLAARAEDCAPPAHVFRVVIAGDDRSDTTDALAACRATLTR